MRFLPITGATALTIALLAGSAFAQQTTTPMAPEPAPVAGDVSSDDPTVKVNITTIQTALAEEFPLPIEEMVTELDVPVDVASASCAVGVDTLQATGAGIAVTCDATSATPELLDFLKNGADAESDEIPDVLKAPPA